MATFQYTCVTQLHGLDRLFPDWMLFLSPKQTVSMHLYVDKC